MRLHAVKLTLALASLSFSVAPACSKRTEDVSDTKTNWLKACDEDLECGSELSCTCGICTITCDSDRQCKSEGVDAACAGADTCSEGLDYCVPNPSPPSSGGASSSAGGSTGAGGRAAGGSATASGGDSGLGGAAPATGGTESTGGTVGSGGSATGSGGGSSTDCGCVDDAIDWHLDGGLVGYLEEHELADCNTFSYIASPVLTDPATETCSRALDSCEGFVSPAEVQVAVDNAEVQAALSEAPVLYGVDNRPVDGQVFVFEIAGARVEVGDPCTECENPIPEGVSELVDLLKRLATEQLAEPPCDELNLP